MSKVVMSEFLTLDGVMQGPGGVDEDRRDGFDKGGWLEGYSDDTSGAFLMAGFAAMDGLLLGRRTYDIFAGFWPTVAADDPIGVTMNGVPKYVASTTLSEPLAWDKSTLLNDVIADVAKLRAAPGGDIQVIGSGGLVQTLIEHDLVDEYRLMVFPLLLGTGKRLFRDEKTVARLRLVDTKATSTGVLLLTYVPETGGAPTRLP